MSRSHTVGKHFVEDGKQKAVWDDKQMEIFIKICIQEVREGNRPKSHFNKNGWTNLQDKFNKLLNKKYDMKQFKYKWENLKKDWQIWKKIIGSETGLGWNSLKRTIDAPSDWWAQKLKEMPHAVKFRDKGLPFPDEMNILFGDVVASGAHAWTPASGSLPQMYEGSQGISDHVIAMEGSGDSDDTNTEYHFNSSRLDSSINIELRDEGSKMKGKRKQDLSSSSNTSKKKTSKVETISKLLDKLSGAFDSYRAFVEKKTEDDGGLKACLHILNSLSIDKTSEFFYDY